MTVTWTEATGYKRKVLTWADVSNTWETVTPPTGWTWTLPFTIKRNRRVFRAFGWTIDQNKPTGKAYYVSMTGSDTNDGLTAATPLRKIYTAFLKADCVMVYVAAGYYGWGFGWITNPYKDLSVIATGGRVVIGGWADTLTWALDVAGGNPNTYKCTRDHIGRVADASIPDANGDHTFLTLQVSAALVEANPGSWYTDGTSVWVRASDDRAPDANGEYIRLYFDNVNRPAQFTGNYTLYCEGCDFEGGASTAFYIAYASGPATGYFNNCTFKYGADNAFTSVGAITYCYLCTAAAAGLDGFNYHLLTDIPYFVEIGCIGRNNGTVGDTIDNASTGHDGFQGVRLNGLYYSTQGRPIHDINNGSKSWLLGCYSHHALAGYAAIQAGTGGSDTCILWLDRCETNYSTYDLYSNTGSTINTKFFIGHATNSGAGTITTY